MPRYQARPVVIEAEKFDGTHESAVKIQKWASENKNHDIGCHHLGSTVHFLTIPTLEGKMTANPGDYIIRGTQGEFYPCKPAIFEAKYELVS